MTSVERWVRRLTVGVVSAVTVTLFVTTSLSHDMTWMAWVAVALLAGAEALCLVTVGRLPIWTATAATGVGVLLPLMGSAGQAPDAAHYASGVWYVAGALALILLLLWGGRPTGAWIILTVLVAHTFVWGGLEALASLGVLAMVILLAAVTAARSAIIRAEAALDRSTATEREAIEWRMLQAAYHQERQARLAATADTVGPMLQRIAETGGRLTAADRHECRLLEQTVRDEIRGRRLLNAAVREQVLAHRRRGATVQINDDGGLDNEDTAAVDAMLHQVAHALRDVTSDRIIIRTLAPNSTEAISVVATTTDPIAAALGIESDDDTVDLWLELPRPSSRQVISAGS